MAAVVEAHAPEIAFSLSSVYSYWKEFDLDGRRSKLDEIGLKVASLQEHSTANRKKLADATREFKRSSAAATTAAECSTAAGNLLRQYQDEIDALTRRAKHGESAFLDLYEQLFEAPDPAQALAVALDNETQMSQLTAQAQKVASELAEYKAESKAIKNQDLTIRKQEEAIRELSAALQAKDEELSDARKQAAAEADAAVLQRMQAREDELSEMLAGAQSSLEAMQRLYAAAQNQLFELQSTREEAAAGRQEEVELAAAELEAVQARLMSLEAEKGSLKGKLEASRSAASAGAAGGQAASSSIEDTLRQELNSQREVASRLRQDLAAARQALHDTAAQWEERCSSLQEQLEQQQQSGEQLQRELHARPTVGQLQELQQQVRALQAIGYGSVEELQPFSPQAGNAAAAAGQTAAAAAADAKGMAGPATAAAGGGLMNLEGLLLAKSRKLEHEVTMAKLAMAEASQELAAAREQVAELQEQQQQQSDLISRLEDDLLAVRQGTAGTAAAAAAPGTAAAAAATGLVGAAGSGSLPAPLASADDDANSSSDSHMLRVLVGQRDRLKQRVGELELQLAATRGELQTSQHELSAARADNVALVERLRYVGGYRQQAAAARSSAAATGAAGGDVEAGGGDVVGKYSALYDEAIDPFKEFQGQQREQKRRQMSVADKAMYSVGSLVYQSGAARLLTFAYLVVLHLLVFGSLTHMTHRTSDHIMDHHELLLQNRHDLTSMMHHDGTALPGGSSAAAAAAGSQSPGHL
uniref:Protein CASP n=1 Tax=Tetradesmus obliquus TaxID=3088 RepID=A0A383WP23_TETOB|eukprot:jgi/Sobl393_1/13833/SZX78952.1